MEEYFYKLNFQNNIELTEKDKNRQDDFILSLLNSDDYNEYLNKCQKYDFIQFNRYYFNLAKSFYKNIK